jgi:uncharacterized protein YxeA
MSQLVFREKLSPSYWVWLFLIGIDLMFAISFSAVFDNIAAIVLFVILLIIFILTAFFKVKLIKVDQEYLYVDKAKLPLKIITRATPMSVKDTSKLRGVAVDLKAFHVISPLVTTSIKIDFDDRQDPHSYWLVSTRKANELSTVLAKRLNLE